MEQLYIGIDLGGTNIAAGIVNKKGEILFKKSIRTSLPKTEKQIEDMMFTLCNNLCKKNSINIDKDIKYVGIGTPGGVDSQKGIVGFNANFGYQNWELKKNMQKLFNIPVFVENDANAALIAEVYAGNARGYTNAVIVTLGTGVGGGVMIDSKIFSGSNFMGTEIGHMVIDFDGRKCNCGRNGCFERYASASALAKDAQNAILKNNDTLIFKVAKNKDKINAKNVFDAMKLGDTTAKKLVDRYIKYLACGIINIINIFQPQIICIGGGISNEKNSLIAPLQKIINKEEYARNMPVRTKVVSAKFKNDAGIIGAALLGVSND